MVSIPAAYSQAKLTIDEAGLLKKIEKSDQDIANPKKADNPSTWINRGKVFFDAATAVSGNFFDGLDPLTATIMFGEPTQKEDVVIGSTHYVKQTFPYFIGYFDGEGHLRAWEVTHVVYENAIEEAVAAYAKAHELDQTTKSPGKNAGKISAGLNEIYNYLYKEASVLFSLGDYKGAAAIFEKAQAVVKTPGFVVDAETDEAALYHDTGVAFLFSNQFQKAVDNFLTAEKLGYERDGEIYYLLYHSYKGVSDTDREILEQAKNMLEKGLAKYPENANIIECVTDVYVALGEDPQGIIPVVQEAISKDPSNPALWNGIGRIYERLGDLDKSIQSFEHVAELMPDSFNAHYSVGILYIRKADAFMTKVNSMPFSSQAEYNAEVEKVYDVYMDSVGPLERAHELNPADAVTVELLKNVYFRLRDKPGMQEKYEYYNELYSRM